MQSTETATSKIAKGLFLKGFSASLCINNTRPRGKPFYNSIHIDFTVSIYTLFISKKGLMVRCV